MRVLFLILALATVARAQPVEERARRLSDEGLAQFNQGHYREAVESFSESFKLRPLPLLLFNIAQAHRLAGDCAPARDAYRRYLDENPRAPNRKLAEAFLLDMEKCAVAPAPPELKPEFEPPPSSVISVPTSVLTPVSMAPPPHKHRPLIRQWWLWTTIGVSVVAVAVGLGIGLSQSNPPTPSLGTVTWHP